MPPASNHPARRNNPRLHGVDPRSRRDIWLKKLLYPAHTIPTAAAPVLVGTGFAIGDGVFRWGPMIAVFVFGWFVQLGGVLADNYYNLVRHRDDAEHPALVTALEQDLLTLREIRVASLTAFLVAAIAGLLLVVVGGIPVVLVGVASIVASLLYSAELTDLPLHDLYFFVFFGPVSVGGTYYVQAVGATATGFPMTLPPGTLPLVVVFAGLPIGALTTTILVVDNVRDLEFDREKNDTTLAVLLGDRASRYQYHALVALAYLVPLVLWGHFETGSGLLLPLLSLPLAVVAAWKFHSAETYVELHPISPLTGRVLLFYAVLLAIGATLHLGSA